jgi:hypothetical protein
MFSQYFVLDEMIVDKLLIVNGELGVVLLSPFHPYGRQAEGVPVKRL